MKIKKWKIPMFVIMFRPQRSSKKHLKRLKGMMISGTFVLIAKTVN